MDTTRTRAKSKSVGHFCPDPIGAGVYNREMKRLMLRHAFRFVESVVFLVGPQNLRSQKAMEKIGGVRIEARLDATGGECVVYQITAATFAL